MFNLAIKRTGASLARPLAFAASRPITTSRIAKAGGGVPIIQGEAAPSGTVPTDIQQATGLERMELLEKMEGRDPFHMSPLEVPHMGTPKNPVKVFSLDSQRIVGCTGFPVDSHDTLYYNIQKDKPWRCTECGCVYAIDFHGDPHAHHH